MEETEMKKLLSLPPNLVEAFHEVTGLSPEDYFCTCDPIGHRLGSGGGTLGSYKKPSRLKGVMIGIAGLRKRSVFLFTLVDKASDCPATPYLVRY